MSLASILLIIFLIIILRPVIRAVIMFRRYKKAVNNAYSNAYKQYSHREEPPREPVHKKPRKKSIMDCGNGELFYKERIALVKCAQIQAGCHSIWAVFIKFFRGKDFPPLTALHSIKIIVK